MKPSILIISDKNETRGPMLEGWLKYYIKSSAEVSSVGLKAEKLNLIAAKAMMEAVIDITKFKSRSITELEKEKYDWIVTLTEQARIEAEKKFPTSKIIHKPVEHPLNESDEDLEKLKKHRKTVNEMEEFAMEFIHTHIRKLY